ncbi:hypothetical protein SLS60_002583 [Paraconiothyrium brasiliense]|uniref:Uncharacterized protein n=1 Tax=Paraconiothyrium brasiliense TaxID=300254 RepID=A0ABR3RTT3_9PLEO
MHQLDDEDRRKRGLMYAVADLTETKSRSFDEYYATFAAEMNRNLQSDECNSAEVQVLLDRIVNPGKKKKGEAYVHKALSIDGTNALRRNLRLGVFEYTNTFREHLRLTPLSEDFLAPKDRLKLKKARQMEVNKEGGASAAQSYADGSTSEALEAPGTSAMQLEAVASQSEVVQAPNTSPSLFRHHTNLNGRNPGVPIPTHDIRIKDLEEETYQLLYENKKLKEYSEELLEKDKEIESLSGQIEELKRCNEMLAEENWDTKHQIMATNTEDQQKLWSLSWKADARSMESGKILTAVFGRPELDNKMYPRPVPHEDLETSWRNLCDQATNAFHLEEDLGPIAADTNGLRNVMSLLLGSIAEDDAKFSEFLTTIGSRGLLMRAFGMLLVSQWVFASPYPKFFTEAPRNMITLYQLVAQLNTGDEVAKLHSAGCIMMTESKDFLEEQLPKRVDRWHKKLVHQFGVFFMNDLGCSQYWHRGPAETTSYRKRNVTELFIQAVKLKLLCLPTRPEDHFHLLWASTEAKFDESWMVPEDNDIQHDPTNLKVKLCVAPALLQGVPRALRQQDYDLETGHNAKTFFELVFGRKFSMSATGGGIEAACSEAGIDHGGCLAKARVVLY